MKEMFNKYVAMAQANKEGLIKAGVILAGALIGGIVVAVGQKYIPNAADAALEVVETVSAGISE